MDKNYKKHGYLLHKSIRRNDFRRFNTLLRKSHLGINMQNKDGDTPLLTGLKQEVGLKFIKPLLAAGAKIMITNNEGITPLSFAINTSFKFVHYLLQYSKEADLFSETTLCKKMHRAVKTRKCRFITFIINQGLDNEKSIVVIIKSNPLYSENVVIRELNVFLNYLEHAEDFLKFDFSQICTILLQDSLCLKCATIFTTIWNRVDHKYIAYLLPTLLQNLVGHSRYENSKFIECLHLILTSPYAKMFTVNYCGPRGITFYQEMYWKFSLRQIAKYKTQILQTMLLSAGLVTVRHDDIFTTYYLFGFNEEMLILLQQYDPVELRCDEYIQTRNIILKLENNPKFSIDNLDNLPFVFRSCYRKLLYILPERAFNGYETIRLKKRVLNKVPSLFELSTHCSQKYIQNISKVQNTFQFNIALCRSRLPNQLKRILCKNPPLYYV